MGTHYHTKCSLVYSLQIKPEIDSYDGHKLGNEKNKRQSFDTKVKHQTNLDNSMGINSRTNPKILKTTTAENVLIRNPNLEHIKHEIIVSPVNQVSSYKTAEKFMMQG